MTPDHRPALGAVRRSFAPWEDASTVPLVRFEAVTKRYGAETAVDQVSLDIYEREFFALLGPSGCGKTTLMRMLAGFETPSAGRVTLGGRDLVGEPAHLRAVNMMFQSYALFPHMTVAKNIAFGLEMEGLGKPEIAARLEAILALVKLEAFATRKPHQLSGGQRQRVALARALIKRPKVLLLDEPLGALDRKLREETQFELMALQESLGLTFIVVTHDQDEAMTMATRIAVMEKGRIAQVAPPAVIYEAPSTRYVAGFIGDINLVEGVVTHHEAALAQVETALGSFAIETHLDVVVGQAVAVAWRPEKTRIVGGEEAIAGGPTVLPGIVHDIGYLGDWSTFRVTVGDITLRAAVANSARRAANPLSPGDAVRLVVASDATILLTR
ncbi:MAG: ABC transporter ATP-binding protein [Alphaproteobacteria bacterium]